jgi:hypothetical protein
VLVAERMQSQVSPFPAGEPAHSGLFEGFSIGGFTAS